MSTSNNLNNDNESTNESAIKQLVLARLKDFFREPAAVFWVYGFPLLMALALGTAFRERPIEKLTIDLYLLSDSESQRSEILTILKKDPRLIIVESTSEILWKKRLRSGKTDLVLELNTNNLTNPTQWEYKLWDEPNRPESVLARNAVQNTILRTFLKPDAPTVKEHHLEELGIRYIDFLIPGLVGMNLMGGGLWGVGFVIVDMRVRKLLKRFLATPMKKRDFLLSIAISRLCFSIPEVIILLGFGYLFFGVQIQGNLLYLLFTLLLGGFAFSGVGLLVASRAKTVETVSGLMNLVMLPMTILSGVFFSSEKFPEFMQPILQLLPLTALNDALRGIMLEGQSLTELVPKFGILLIWGVICFIISLKIFRWK